MHSPLAIVLLLLVSIALCNAKDAITPVAYPAVQSSVTSTAFNPAETNAGGTTNSAGTFDVVSLAQSTSYSYNSAIPQTTSFVVSAASFAPAASESTPAYYTASPSVSAAKVSSTGSSISLITTASIASVSALKTVSSDGAMMNMAWGSMWTLAISTTMAVVGAVFVL